MSLKSIYRTPNKEFSKLDISYYNISRPTFLFKCAFRQKKKEKNKEKLVQKKVHNRLNNSSTRLRSFWQNVAIMNKLTLERILKHL